MLVFTLAAKRASQRVDIWRKLRRYGALPLKSSGYVLPKTAMNEERFQWLAAEVRKSSGEASVIEVKAIDDLPPPKLVRLFMDARAREYEELGKELQKQLRAAQRPAGVAARLRRRFQEIADRDFFPPPVRSRVEQQLARLDAPEPAEHAGRRSRKEFFGRRWVTRPRPGIDRVASAWLIRRFIDPNATFGFADAAGVHPEAVPFDMFGAAGFGHRGDRCTFETLIEAFALRDARLAPIAQAVHDADLADEKFGRIEALGIERVLVGWANQGLSDDELLRRGMEMIEGWFQSL
jgi:hypothetical protein